MRLAGAGAAGRIAPVRRLTAGLRGVWYALGITDTEAGRVRLHTVTVLRWIAVGGQLFTILFVRFSLGIDLPLGALLPAVVLTGAINLALVLAYKAPARLGERSAAILFAYDVVQLCYLLALTGGIQNPFAILIVLPVTLAAATLGFGATLAVTSLALFGTTAIVFVPTELPLGVGQVGLPPLYLLGSWSALAMAIILVAIFAWNIAEEARRRAAALQATQAALGREQQLSALGAQAAAAAHMLGSPLATINVIAKELDRELTEDDPLHEEVAELLSQAQRCREILATLGRRSEVARDHEQHFRLPLSSLLRGIADELARPHVAVTVTVEGEASAEPALTLPPALRHALANLIDNAIEFARSEVRIRVVITERTLVIDLEDDGPGFSPEVLDWLGEPYLSTRQGEGGLGLGVFIATTLLARTGARLQFDNGRRGAHVTITWSRVAVGRLAESSFYE